MLAIGAIIIVTYLVGCALALAVVTFRNSRLAAAEEAARREVAPVENHLWSLARAYDGTDSRRAPELLEALVLARHARVSVVDEIALEVGERLRSRALPLPDDAEFQSALRTYDGSPEQAALLLAGALRRPPPGVTVALDTLAAGLSDRLLLKQPVVRQQLAAATTRRD